MNRGSRCYSPSSVRPAEILWATLSANLQASSNSQIDQIAAMLKSSAARAIEVALLSGQPLSHWQEHARAHGALTPWYVFLTAPRAVPFVDG